MAKWLEWKRWKMPSPEPCPLQEFGVSLAGVKVQFKRWSFVSCFFTHGLLFQVKKMLTKENKGKDCLILYQHKCVALFNMLPRVGPCGNKATYFCDLALPLGLLT